jgi:hypothetical protein
LSQIVVVAITGEAILIGLHLSNINKEDGVLSAVFYSLKEWRKPLCEEDSQLKHYSPSQGHQMKAVLPLHVLQLALFLLSFPICSTLTVLVSGVFKPWLCLLHNIPSPVGLQCKSPELLFAHVMQLFCPHNLFFLDCPEDGGSKLLQNVSR